MPVVAPRDPARRRAKRRGLTVGLAVLVLGAFVGPAFAETPEPSSPATPETSSPAAGSPTPTGPATDPTTEAATDAEPASTPEPASPTAPPSDTTAPTTAPPRAAAAVPSASLTLTIAAAGSPVAGKFFEDIGSYAVSGALSPAAAGQRVTLFWYDPSAKRWSGAGSALTDAQGRYALSQRVGHAATIAFRATIGGAPGAATVSSNDVRVTVRDATVALSAPSSIDSLVNPTLSGSVSPARAGVRVSLDVVIAGRWRSVAASTTTADGRYRVPFTYGTGNLARYTVRAAYRAANRPRTEVSRSAGLTRAKVINAVVRKTTSADVAKTYRSGCPVGPSKLATVSMNYYGYDRRMHRGVIIVRKDLADDTVRGFNAALKAGFAISKMRNPNVYGGNDPKQMAANNTSGFNCRKVVGNPLRMSPHSYGIALDVNTVQNPYRDVNGKWWPSNGKKYRDRSPMKKGMLNTKSALTKQLKKDRYFWGGLWSPGRDYQHYERR